MISILKGNSPKSLQEAFSRGGSYDDFRDKGDIRAALLIEQGYLCAYCMSRISERSMKIEHWVPQSIAPDLGLDYKNMLGVCKGNEGTSVSNLHCDSMKGNCSLKYNPAEVDDAMLQIEYRSDGTIRSNDTEFDIELNNKLNLNVSFLKNNRKSALRGYQNAFEVKYKGKTVIDKKTLQKDFKKAGTRGIDGKFIPYNGIILYWLAKKLGK